MVTWWSCICSALLNMISIGNPLRDQLREGDEDRAIRDRLINFRNGGNSQSIPKKTVF
jgi:hypothetical protein